TQWLHVLFFFSSRRRHTRSKRDWSSDVCSSDLLNRSTDYAIQMLLYLAKEGKTVSSSKLAASMGVSHRYLLHISSKLRAAGFIQIGRASCRERVEGPGVGVAEESKRGGTRATTD